MAIENVELYEVLSYGQDFVGEFVLYDDDPPTIPSNLTGYTAKMEFRKKLDPTETPLFTLTTEGGGITTVPLEGKIFWTITSAQTKLHIGRLYTELRLIDPLNKNSPAIWGSIEIKFRGTVV
jgi:hypothetical protein